MKKIEAQEADSIFPGDWFQDYTSEVALMDVKVEVEKFEDQEDEFVVFNKGLSSKTINLGNNHHSIYAVNGEVEADNMILGDAVFVVNGVLTVKDWLLLPPTNGVFQVNGEQFDNKNEAILKHIICPLVILFDRFGREVSVYKKVNNEYLEIAAEDLVEEVMNDGEIDSYLLLKQLQEQNSIFKNIG